MPTYECEQCKYQTTRRSNYNKHIETKIHQGLPQQEVSFLCECCNKCFSTDQSLNRHKTTPKYMNYIEKKAMGEEIHGIKKQLNETNIKVNTLSNKVTKYNRSVMRILKEDYSNNPALEELTKDEIILALEQEYKEKYVEQIHSDEDAKLQKKIIADFENNKITNVMGKIILNFIKKESKELQSVFNTDFSRSNYATKTKENWLNDKLGLKFKELVLKPIINTINKVVTNYDNYLVRCAKKNKNNLDTELCNHIVDNKIKLLDFIDYFNEPKNQEQIIYKISPRLQLEYAN